MLAILSRLFSNLLIGGCFLSLTFLFFSLAALFRLLPIFVKTSRKLLHWLLILSARGYVLVLGRHQFGAARVLMTTVISIGLGSFLCWLIAETIHTWVIIVTVIHGLSVGLAWEDLLNPGGLHLGLEIQ